jgi:predicted AAA+ superfamily ATPase
MGSGDEAAGLSMGTYRERVADRLLRDALGRSGAVQIVGPKWSGKTTMAEQAAKTVVYFQDPDERDRLVRIADSKPSLLLAGEKPVLLDEWQDAPKMWDAVRFAVDKGLSPGQFILTGSTISDSDEVRHSGTGRFARLHLRTMSLAESGDSDRSVSLSDIAAGGQIISRGHADLEDVARWLVRGGWPAAVLLGDTGGLARDYVESIVNLDSSRVDGVEKNPRRVRLLMRSLARNESTAASISTLIKDMATDDSDLSRNTVPVYLNALRRLFVLEEQEAWASAVRSKQAIRTSPIRRYCDPSISAALLGLTPDKLLRDFSTFGLLFESLCVRDLKVYASVSQANVYHFRDASGLECDAVIEYPDSSWGAVEIKLESARESQGIRSLSKIGAEVRSQHAGPPKFLLLVTSGGIAHKRDDGIYVVPIDCLGP